MSFYDELDSFMALVRETNTGTDDDVRKYEQVSGFDGSVQLYGPYRIRSDEWESLTEQAGIQGARWEDRKAQDAVVRHQFTRLYNAYGGRWDGVAIAWNAGEKAAQLIINDGYPVSSVIGGDRAFEMDVFIEQTAMKSESDGSEAALQGMMGEQGALSAMQQDAPKPKPNQMRPDDAIAGVLTNMVKMKASRKEADNAENGQQGNGSDGTPESTEGSGV